ncbi:hypothetical protein SFRURICE_013690 [Spodoptera frugiperda]|uniref:SFRICE_032347 n=1 Tax=Spodoptera frugiperda TaxID=7108 RepID=A0A2H1WYI5_SPOFR|nr:hypothetical protein SFRURICE_013690 [Spodoptera frugiperda]
MLPRPCRPTAGQKPPYPSLCAEISTANPYLFKSQTSLSTDSGLCTERGLRRTHIELIKPPGKRIGLKLAGNTDFGSNKPYRLVATQALPQRGNDEDRTNFPET